MYANFFGSVGKYRLMLTFILNRRAPKIWSGWFFVSVHRIGSKPRLPPGPARNHFF